VTASKKLCEDYKKRKVKAFKQDLNELLDKYEFSGWRRARVTEECLEIVEEQVHEVVAHHQMILDLKDKKKVV